jgi:hypothetical protein
MTPTRARFLIAALSALALDIATKVVALQTLRMGPLSLA